MKPRVLMIGVALLTVVAANPASAQNAAPAPRPTAKAVRLSEPPRLDGNVLDDPAWKAVEPITGFWQTAPDAGQPVSEPTEVRIALTADTLYVGVVCVDHDPGGLIVSEARRDSSMSDTDSVRMIFDTYHDGQNGFVFGTTPAGVEYDGQVTQEGVAVNPGPGGTGGGGGGGGGRQQAGSGGGFNLNWDGSWQVRTTTSETGWSAEFAIPLRTLRYAPGSGQTWGLNFERTIKRRKETAFWAPLPIQFDLYRVSVAGTLVGLDLPTQRSLKVVPYALGRTQKNGTRGLEAESLGDIGADAKYSLTPSLTLDATLNTDFAQVEVDEQQINLDRFNLLFPEKRPFFLENAGLFAVGSPGEAEVFFSRRIGIGPTGEAIPIRGGARLSGRAGPVNVGVLNMQTDDTGGKPGNNFTVARVRRDLPNRTNIGLIYVGRQATGDRAGTDNYNRAFAADARIGIRTTGLVTAFVARTMTPGVAGSEHAYQIQVRNETQPLTLSAGYTETGTNFNPEVGFLSRAGGFRKMEVAFNGRIRPNDWLGFQELRPHSQYRLFFDHAGFWQTGYWHLDNHWELKSGWEFHTGMNTTHEGVTRAFAIVPGVTVPAGSYDHHEVQLVLQTDDAQMLSGRMQVNAGGVFGGSRVVLTQSVRFRGGDALAADVSWTRNDYSLPLGAFVTNLARTRISYSFRPNVFLQALVQYNDRDDVWSSNFRFGWLQQANTGLFIVYTDSHPFDDLTDRFGSPRYGPDRSLAVKFSRMFDVLD